MGELFIVETASGTSHFLGGGFDSSSSASVRVFSQDWINANLAPGLHVVVWVDDQRYFGIMASGAAAPAVAAVEGLTDPFSGNITPTGVPVMSSLDIYGGDGSLVGDPAVFGLPAAVGLLSGVISVIPDAWRNVVFATLAAAGVVKGASIGKAGFLTALRARGALGVAAAAMLSLVLADSFVIDADIPFVPSIGGGNGAAVVPHVVALGDFAVAQHGPGVKEWVANGNPFVMFLDGTMAAMKRNGSWKFWKPKKPIVYVPGGPMSRKTARRLATVYNNEKKRAKKDFNLVDSRQGQGSRAPKTVVIKESGPGSVNL